MEEKILSIFIPYQIKSRDICHYNNFTFDKDVEFHEAKSAASYYWLATFFSLFFLHLYTERLSLVSGTFILSFNKNTAPVRIRYWCWLKCKQWQRPQVLLVQFKGSMYMFKGLSHFQWSGLLVCHSCVRDHTKLQHRVQKYHQFLLQHDCIRDTFSCHLSSSEEESKVSKIRNGLPALLLCLALQMLQTRRWVRQHHGPVRIGFVSSHFIWGQSHMTAGEQWGLLSPQG